MATRRFSRSPQVSNQSRPAHRVELNSLPSEIQEFKQTYISERRVLERFRLGAVTLYEPAPSLDGKSKFDSPEERTMGLELPKVDSNSKRCLACKVRQAFVQDFAWIVFVDSHN